MLKLIKNILIVAAMFTLLAVPLFQPMSPLLQLKYLVSVGVVGLLANYILQCPLVDLMAFLSFIFYRQTNDPDTMLLIGAILLLYHARVYLIALFARVELGTTHAVLFLLSTIYSYFLFFNCQVSIVCQRSVLAKTVFLGKLHTIVLQKTVPIIFGVLLGEALFLWFMGRVHQHKILTVIYSLFTVAFTTTIILFFKGFALFGTLILFGFGLQAAGRSSKQRSLVVLGWMVIVTILFLLIRKFVAFKIVMPRNK